MPADRSYLRAKESKYTPNQPNPQYLAPNIPLPTLTIFANQSNNVTGIYVEGTSIRLACPKMNLPIST